MSNVFEDVLYCGPIDPKSGEINLLYLIINRL